MLYTCTLPPCSYTLPLKQAVQWVACWPHVTHEGFNYGSPGLSPQLLEQLHYRMERKPTVAPTLHISPPREGLERQARVGDERWGASLRDGSRTWQRSSNISQVLVKITQFGSKYFHCGACDSSTKKKNQHFSQKEQFSSPKINDYSTCLRVIQQRNK